MKTFIYISVIAAESAVLLFQHSTQLANARHIDTAGATLVEVQRLERERRALLAKMPSADRQNELRAEHAALAALGGAASSPKPTATAPADPMLYPVTTTGSVFDPRHVETSDLEVKTQWRNVGLRTPEAAFETMCWAANAGDLDMLASTMAIDPAARAKAQAMLDQMPAAMREQFRSADRLVAALFLTGGTPFEAIKVLDVQSRDNGEKVLHTLWQYGDGRIRDNTLVVMQQTAAGWQRQMSPAMVDLMMKTYHDGYFPGIPAK